MERRQFELTPEEEELIALVMLAVLVAMLVPLLWLINPKILLAIPVCLSLVVLSMLTPGLIVFTLQDVRVLVTAILKYTEKVICDWAPESDRLDLIFKFRIKSIQRHPISVSHTMNAGGDH